MEEQDTSSYKGTTINGIECDFFSCIEVMEARLMKHINRIEEKIDEQNKKLNMIIDSLLPRDTLHEEIPTSNRQSLDLHQLSDHTFVELPVEHIQEDSIDTIEIITDQKLESLSRADNSLLQQIKKRKFFECSDEPEVVEICEIIPQNRTGVAVVEYQEIADGGSYQEVEVTASSDGLGQIKQHRPQPTKITTIPPLPINNIEMLRALNKCLLSDRGLASDLIQILSGHCNDGDKQSAPTRMLSAVIGEDILRQSTWASKSTGRLRIAALGGVLSCMLKAASQSACGAISITFFRERVMEILHMIKIQCGQLVSKVEGGNLNQQQ